MLGILLCVNIASLAATVSAKLPGSTRVLMTREINRASNYGYADNWDELPRFTSSLYVRSEILDTEVYVLASAEGNFRIK
jgi:hypothetical protein